MSSVHLTSKSLPVDSGHSFRNAIPNIWLRSAASQSSGFLSVGVRTRVESGFSPNRAFFFRMDDRGEVKCIKFSLENKILAVQRTSKAVVRHSLEQHRKESGCLEETESEFWLFARPQSQ